MKTSSTLTLSTSARSSMAPKPSQKQIIQAMAQELAEENAKLNAINNPKQAAIQEQWKIEAQAIAKKQAKTASIDIKIWQPRIAEFTITPSQKMIDLEKQRKALEQRPVDQYSCELLIKNKIESEMLANIRTQLSENGLIRDSLVALNLL